MGNVILGMTVSLDGYIAGTNDADGGLHQWYFAPSETDRKLIDELIQSTGAIVMGRRSYDIADEYDGFVDNPYPAAHFVVTHKVPQRLVKGKETFRFVTDGVESALQQAQAAAGDKHVVIGGANIARQFLKAGLLDEIQIHLVPVLLGDSIRLFDNIGTEFIELEHIHAIESDGVTHLKYRVVK